MSGKVRANFTVGKALVIGVIVLVGAGGYLLGAHTNTGQTRLDNAAQKNEYVPAAVLQAYNTQANGTGALDKCYNTTHGYDYDHPVYIIEPSAHRGSFVTIKYYFDTQGKSLGQEVNSDVQTDDRPAPIDLNNYDCYRLKDPGPLFSTE